MSPETQAEGFEVLMPPLSQTMDSLVLVEWLKQPGDPVRAGEPLYVVETDKANLEVESPAAGILGENLAARGASFKVGTVIAVILPIDSVVGPKSGAAIPKSGRIMASPRARKRAAELGIDLGGVTATGPRGMVVERDLQGVGAADAGRVKAGESVRPVGQVGLVGLVGQAAPAAAAPPPTAPPTPAANDTLEVIPLAGTRAVIASRMAASHSATAPVTLTAEADASALVRLRTQFGEDGLAVSYNDLLLRIVGSALREHPRLNASLSENAVRVWRRIDIGLAVDTDRGLLVPVLRDVDRLGLAEIARQTTDLAGRARLGACTPDELQGGTFTLTNLGMYGIDAFTPIINLPECAILGVGRIKTQAAWTGSGFEPREMVWLSLTFDHRLVDGGPAARFLQRVVQLVEKPHLLLA